MAEDVAQGSFIFDIILDALTEFADSMQATFVTMSTTASAFRRHPMFQIRMPSQPKGADTILKSEVILTLASAVRPSPGLGENVVELRSVPQAFEDVLGSPNESDLADRPAWTNIHYGRTWAETGGTAGGSTDKVLSSRTLSISPNERREWDFSALGLTWDDRQWFTLRPRPSLGYRRVNEFWSLNAQNSTSYTSATTSRLRRPRVNVTFLDNPPPAITDLNVGGDTTLLTEGSYSYRRWPRLTWSKSAAADFYRYRIRRGVNRTSATNHAHVAFVYTAGSNSYVDRTLFSDGSTVYYTMYTEDGRNTSAATNANVSNRASIKVPLVPAITVTSSASVLDLVRVNATVRDGHAGSKIVWGDGSTSFTRAQDTTGSFYTATHRYTRATTVTVRVQNESTVGFRSGFTNTSRAIGHLPPVARLSSNPVEQRTGSTFSFGTPGITLNNTTARRRLYILDKYPSSYDGVVTRLRFLPNTAGASSTSTFLAYLFRPEAGGYRVIHVDEMTLGTVTSPKYRNVQWKASRGDVLGLRDMTGTTINGFHPSNGGATAVIVEISGTSSGSVIFNNVGDFVPHYRARPGTTGTVSLPPHIRAWVASTNPVLFSAKDSYARSANRAINRFRWAPDLRGGTFPNTAASYYDTGATSFFWWAWTASTHSNVAVRAVDVSHSSSVSAAPVRVSTEATFRIPDDFRDPVTRMIDKRDRAFAQEPTMGLDYGTLDIGAIGPRTIEIEGRAYTKSSTTNDLIDIVRLSDVFLARRRVYVVIPTSAGTTVQGYITEQPIVQTGDAPVEKRWSTVVRVVR